jgi:acyl-CoA dehydrogenase
MGLGKRRCDLWTRGIMSSPARPENGFSLDAERLAAYLRAAGHIGSAPLEITPLSGGQSNPTYLLRCGGERLVLRKQPPGKLLPSAHAIDREYRVMQALAGSGVPVPRMHLYCVDPEVIGTPFFLMEFVDGRIFVEQSLPGMSAAERSALYAEMNRVIATLHGVDYAAVGLADYGKAGNYFTRQIARWSRQYRDSQTMQIAAMDALIDWLPAHIPAGDETSIVHGDYRLDNLVFHPTEPRVLAVLDWELSTLGHPLADFSYHCMSWHIPATLWRGIGGLDLAALGIPDEQSYIAAYCRDTGRTGIAHWNFYLAYNLFRIAAILQGIAGRARDGNANAADAVQMGLKAQPLAELGWACAQRAMAETG